MHIAGECSLEEALDLAITRTRQFARRQERWFRAIPASSGSTRRRMSTQSSNTGRRPPPLIAFGRTTCRSSPVPCDDGAMASAPTPIRLSKHHGLGNDFLVCLTEHLPLDAVTRAAPGAIAAPVSVPMA